MRGRQFYDPIVQVPGKVEGAPDLERIELYPEGASDDPNPKWRGRHIRPDGSIGSTAAGDFDHDRALAQAQELWPGLIVYELRSEGDDSTWDGMSPSPRLWQNAIAAAGVTKEQFKDVLHEAANVVEAHQGSSPGDTDGVSREPSPTGPLSEGVGASPGPGDDDLPPAGELHVLTVGAPGIYVRLSDVLALLLGWADQYDAEKNPSAALAVREVAQTLAVTEQGGQDG